MTGSAMAEGVGSEEILEEVFLDSPMEGAPLTNNNSLFINNVLDNLNDPDLGYLVLSLLVAIVWSVYIILFNSRIQGSILTTILRRFVKSGDLTIGSFSLSVLSGKIMFRNVVYVTEDYSLRIVDGILKFRYWLPYVKRELSEDMSHSDHRLWLELNGPELHIYNRSQLYARLEKVFGQESQLGVGKGGKDEDEEKDEESLQQQGQTRDMSFWQDWRDLIPVIKLELNMARFVFGNRLIPSTLLLTTDKAECTYTTKPAACSLDYFMQVITSKAENFRVILAPSPKYTGMLDEPPRYMGEGFVVMSSSLVNLYYYMDEPGLVPEHPQTMRLPNGDEVTAPAPVWGLDIKCAKGTNLSYGPWADRQREQLFRFFFPQDYQTLKLPSAPKPGDLREFQQFDVRLSILTEATIDILFSKEKETNAVHMNVQRGSYFEMTLPWTVTPTGYVTKINGQLFHVDASTSLQYRNLLEAETLDYHVNIHYPRVWNHDQMWDLEFNSSKATYHFLYAHKEFFQDLIEDWSSRVPPDLLHFVPYSWNFTLKLQEFELVTLANGYNWLDCSSQHQGNAHVAFCGEVFELRFTLPFVDFLPETIMLKFMILAENVDLSLYLPPWNTMRNIIAALDRNAKLVDREDRPKQAFSNDKWRKFCKLSAGWVDCWQVPELELNIKYTYHPVPPLGPSPQANVSTPEKEELLLSPIRAPHRKKSPMEIIKNITPDQFDPTSLTPDCISVDLRITKPSEIKLYGSVLCLFIHLKENIFGEDQKFTDMSQTHLDEEQLAGEAPAEETKSDESLEEHKKSEFDCRRYRQFAVTVYIDIRNVLGHLVKDCTESDPPCPMVALDCLVFEMNKRYSETQLQVVVSPLILTTSDAATHRPPAHQHLSTGFLMLSGLQMRGHAMFSAEERTLDEETLEYAWLVELTIGTLSGKLTTPQLQNIITAVEAFIFTVEDAENSLRHPKPYKLCYHGAPQPQCIHTTTDHFCPTTDLIKYKMVRASVDGLSLNLVESGTLLSLQVYPIRVATCNLHGQHTRSGITAHIQNISARNYICGQDGHKEGAGGRGVEVASMCGTSTSGTGGGTVTGGGGETFVDDVWLEAAAVTLGPVYVDAATSMDVLHHDMQLIQHKFLKQHDEETMRLWFLWPQEATNVPVQVFGKCGCVGGCAFFGNNRNGVTFFKPSKQDFYNGVNVAQYRVNEPDESPGYGQSILEEGQLVFQTGAYTKLATTHCDAHSSSSSSKDHYALSSGYMKSASPATPADPHTHRGSSSLHHGHESHAPERLNPRNVYHRELSVTSHDSSPQVTDSDSRGVSSAREPSKDVVLGVPGGPDSLPTPGSLSDLRRSVDNVNTGRQSKMPSSLSLQTELPLHAAGGHKLSAGSMRESSSRQSLSSQHSLLAVVQRTVSIGSETQSEAFFSADEDQVSKMTVVGSGDGSLSRMSSQQSLPVVPEDLQQPSSLPHSLDHHSSETSTPPTPHHDPAALTLSSNSYYSSADDGQTCCPSQSNSKNSRSRSNSSCSSSSNGSSSSSSGSHSSCMDHSQASLIQSHSSESPRPWKADRPSRARRKADRIKAALDCSGDSSSEVGSVSSTSFISALSSQEDIAQVDLHMQLNKPITESPLLMSSYVNHMTQLRCLNWDHPIPSFDSSPGQPSKCYIPVFEKISEGFTAIRMVEGSRHGIPRSPPPPPSGRTPSHPYTWDTPLFTWGDAQEEPVHEDSQDTVGGVLEANTTRTTVVIKLKKDVDIMLSPMALESAQLFLEALTPVMEALHPLSIINHAHMRSLSTVEGQNTLKKKRYMYWSRLRDKRVAGTPEQSAILSTTYQESCFQQMQGQVTVPRVNVTLLQASVVEEVISFSALDNIRDLTCVSLFSVCLDSVSLQFYSGHQSKKSVQMYMRNPHDPVMQKKSKSKARHTVDLLAEPVYIETSERQQEENMVSVDVSKVHVQLRRLKNESALLKDASVTAIPNHRSKVLFVFRRCPRGEDGDNGGSMGTPVMEDDRMGFIMFEAGLENMALRAVKRKGFGIQVEGSSSGRHDGGVTCAPNCPTTSAGSGGGPSSSSGPGTAGTAEPQRTGSENRREPSDRQCSASVSQVSNMSTHSGIHHSTSSANGSIKDLLLNPSKSDKRDITSFVVELQTVWFNFAAPPHTPITKKIDYTRLDWNLLSTASPSINAWMNPSDRLTVAVIHFLHSSESRRLGVMASLMAEALDVQSIHVPVKNKYVKLMPLSQTLQEDPSCQLCTVLRRYVLQSSPRIIEANLLPPHLPKLASLRQGVVVLSRQWKNALYMPLLMEQTFRNKQTRPAFTFKSHPAPEGRSTPKFDPTIVANEVTDEKTTLLEAEGGSPHSHPPQDSDGSGTLCGEDVTDGVMSSESTQLPPRRTLPSYPPRSSRASVILPVFNTTSDSPARGALKKHDSRSYRVNTSRFQFPKLGGGFGGNIFHRGGGGQQQQQQPQPPPQPLPQQPQQAQQHVRSGPTATAAMPGADNHSGGSHSSGLDRASSSSSLDGGVGSGMATPGRPPSVTCEKDHENLYNWMVRQQEYAHASDTTRPTVTFPKRGEELPLLSDGESERQEHLPNRDSGNVPEPPHSAHFLEAHVIFEPLLSAIGVITQQVNGGPLEQLGSNVSITGSVETLRVDIIESEASKLNRKKRKTGLHPGNGDGISSGDTCESEGKFFLDIGIEVPAFLCERVGLEIDVSKVTDDSREWVNHQPTLFVSRSALKQHTSTMVHFSLNVNYIAQQVNMPLLRLLHQISSMYQNARATQIGLREQRPMRGKDNNLPTHHKEGSYSELHEGEYKANEYSLSISEEQATVSSLAGIKGPRGSVVSSLSTRISPPPTTSRTTRPQSFAQRLRSSTKMSKGYTNLGAERGTGSPLFSISVSGSGLEGATICSSDKSPLLGATEAPTPPVAATATPKCWRNIYYLLDLYTTTPETKTVQQRSSVTGDASEGYKGSRKYDILKESKAADIEAGPPSPAVALPPVMADKTKELGLISGERTPFVVFGLAKIHKTKLLATLSGLKLEAEMNAVHSSLTFREKVRGAKTQVRASHRTSELTHTGHIGDTMIVLLEGIAPNQQTVVRVTIGKSQGLYTSLSRKTKAKNSALITIGDVNVDIPQHPVILHDMMTRSSKQLSSTLMELRVARPSARLSRGATADEPDLTASPRPPQEPPGPQEPIPHESLLHPLVIEFSILLQSLSIQAALLPSLQAQYRMEQVSSLGFTGAKAKFSIHLPTHHLSFSTRLQDLPSDTHLPSSASIQLPQVHVEAELIHDDASNTDQHAAADGMVLREGNYLSAVADIGALEHSLTTDLLNHLVFVQKVFMKEVNEVVQKMAGGDKPVPLWSEEGTSHVSQPSRLLFMLQLRLKGIIITATTPTQSAVRLETGVVELQLSNRVENISRPIYTSTDPTQPMKIFGKAQVDINVALGQLLRNDMFEEAEPEFQQLAFFRTRICLRNALYNEMLSVGEEGEVVLITLTRPLVCVQPLAVDRAVLVWLNYKNAYEYWSEQRASLNKEVLTATQQVFEKVPQFSSLSSAAHITNNVFLHLTVDDIGICLPLNPCLTVSHQVDSTETRDALVVTLENTIISACNSGSLVCKARFKGFCMRFAPEFETSLDDWKPDFKDHNINLCTVSEGTYEVCSRTVAGHSEKAENAKWLLNVQWQMEGVDLHLDVNIGKHLSALARTLTMLTGAPDITVPQGTYDSDDDVDHNDHAASQQESAALRRQATVNESLPAFVFDPSLDARQRAKLLEIEMNEQAKTVNDLKSLGASASTIEQEMRRLQELEALVFHDFRRDVIKKLRRQSVKATSMKDRLGLGPKSHVRSKSFRVPSPTIEVKEPPLSSGSHGSNDQGSVSVDSSPCHTANDNTVQKVKFVDRSQGGSSDSYPNDDLDNSEVFLGTPGHLRTPTPTNLSDPETETITLTTLSNENVENVVPRSVGGLEGLVSVLDQPPHHRPGVGGAKGVSGAGDSGSTPGTATAPLSSHSSAHSSVFPLLPGTTGPITPGGLGSSGSGTVKPLDPSIDLELDVRVCISSGMCNLYTKCVTKEEERSATYSRMKKERSFSGGISETPGSPGSARKKNEGRPNLSSTKLRAPPPPSFLVSSDTVFYIPGLDVKVHYESHNIHEETPVGSGGGLFGSGAGLQQDGPGWSSPSTAPSGSANSSAGGGGSRKSGLSGIGTSGIKRASLFTWLTLQSIKRETTVSPNILEFLELALEPLPVTDPDQKPAATSQEPEPVFNVDVDTSGVVGGGGGPYVYASFPVDVVVYFHMQPSTIRFSCQPVSRVECLLQLPSLNLVFSSKRAEDGSMPDLGSKLQATIGGLSVTGVLEDFSLYVFHPYGGKQRGASGAPYLATSPLATLTDSERKDSLSVMVEFVKFHISRSRKINFKSEMSSKMKASGSSDSKAIIRFSTIVDIGAAHFKYDMRRLTEILAFPRAWYRRSIVRRLFLGDFTGGATSMEWDETSPAPSSSESTPNQAPTPASKRHSSSSSEGLDGNRRENGGASSSSGAQSTPPSSQKGGAGAGSWARDKLRLNFDSDVHPRKSPKLSGVGESMSEEDSNGLGGADGVGASNYGKPGEADPAGGNQTANKIGSWETLVLFAVNFTRLGVQMNMGNVMGNVVWTTKDFKANGRLSIGSTGHKNMYIGLSLGGSGLDAKGGIVGGTIELSEINMYLKIREDPGTEPDHTIGMKLFASQSRLDYMGTSVLMGRVSSFGVTLRDEWKLKQCAGEDDDATRRGATIFILGDLEWDQLQLIISKSTTADLLKMHHKLDEFFSQQFKSSRRVFSSLQPTRHKSSVKQKPKDGNRKLTSVLGMLSGQDARHHRHWQSVLYRVSGLRLTTLPLPLPDSGTVLGGSLELHGKTISLACFHGVNFRSKSWALFSLKEPYINFTSEVQEVPGDPPRDTHIVQNLTFSLGVMEHTHAQHVSMATVCRITRNMVFPPQFRTIQEWFHYAFCTSELDNVDRFPSLDRSDSLPNSSSDGKRSSTRLQDHNHSSETIFALPSMQIHLNTKHLQTATTPDFMDEKPKVECSLVTEFQDHIFVAVDAESFFFLHDLIASYVKDTKEKMARKSKVPGAETDNNKESAEKKPKVVRVNEPTQLLQQDYREFTCTTWHLEPTVRLLSWATKNLEPYGVDYILQKLGFSHARTTIPKWLQRGCMDPLDKVLSMLMFRMIAAIYDHDNANR
ncbi:transmembrane protein KIAA1109 homolog isoform X6 [Eriocheir sinensis]|uniref:transmembrane protein KIAA1109 homolog isoform X6 n=1 Tax=Eriocheir sinensis TaxID=95602 RepID=UPI0021C951C3|nr:transmembrane protein KIAA1109 homolog isoform X6 [Eriocheir sinensis]